MNIETKKQTAIVREPGVLITDGPSAMDLLATARYETGCSALVLFKEQLDESFFRLSTGLAGEVLQKFVNYQMKLAIVGDFDRCDSKPLRDFIRESNEGRQICFQPDEESALAWLEQAGGMIVIGITGPTGAGKTTVLNVLRDMGGAVADCDAVYHELLRTSAPLRAELRARFGGAVFDENGDLRRKALGAIVFEDAGALADLNAITHRHVLAELERLIAQAEAEGRPAIALDAIALMESGAGALCDVTVAVTASEETRVRRIMAREGIGEAYARARVRAQKPASWFEERCAFTLRNDGEKGALEAGARQLFESILMKEDT